MEFLYKLLFSGIITFFKSFLASKKNIKVQLKFLAEFLKEKNYLILEDDFHLTLCFSDLNEEIRKNIISSNDLERLKNLEAQYLNNTKNSKVKKELIKMINQIETKIITIIQDSI